MPSNFIDAFSREDNSGTGSFYNNQANIDNLISRYEALVGSRRNQGSNGQVLKRDIENRNQLYDSVTGKTGLTARERNPFEQALTNAYRWGEDVMGITGWTPDEGFTPENIGRFLISLPFQMVGGFAMGPSQAYEGIAGQNILEGDETKALNYELDPSQRLGQLGNAAINTFALPFGGSARALGAAGKLLTGGKYGDNLLNGYVSRAMPNAKASTRFAAQTAFDSTEEAAEEFSQSYMDDSRWKTLDEGSLDRAITGAEWGALGGAAFSMGGQGVHAAWNKGIRTLTESAAQNPTSSSYSFELEKNQNLNNDSRVAQSVEEARRLKDARDEVIPASSSALNMQVGPGTKFHQIKLGIIPLQGQWESNVEGSREMLSKTFFTDVDTLGNIFNLTDNGMKAKALTDLIKKAEAAGHAVVAAIGRNPDTNPQGSALVDIIEVTADDSVTVNRNAYSFFGMDQDGDKTQVYLDRDKIMTTGYMARNFVSVAGGKARLDTSYFMIHKNDNAKKIFRDWIMSQGGENIEGLSPRAISELFDQGIDEVVSGDKGRDGREGIDHISEALDKAQFYMFRRNFDAGQNAFEAGRNAAHSVGDIMFEMEKGASQFEEEFDRLIETGRQSIREVTEMAEDLENRFLDDKKWADISPTLQKLGTIPGKGDFAHMVAWLGGKHVRESFFGNAMFRQAGQLKHESDRAVGWSIDFSSSNEVRSLMDAMIAWQFSQVEVGNDVETAIENLYRAYVAERTFKKIGGQSLFKINSMESYETFVNAFEEAIAEGNKIYNDSWVSETTRGKRRDFTAPEKKNIDKGHPAEVSRAFLDIFGDARCEELFTMSRDDSFYGMTISNAVAKASIVPGVMLDIYTKNPGMNKIWNSLVRSHGTKERAVGAKIEEALSDAHDKLRAIFPDGITYGKSKKRSNWKTVKADDFATLCEVHNGFCLILGPTACLELKIHTIEGFVNSTWGQALINGDKDFCYNSMLSVLLTAQYKAEIATFLSIDKSDVARMNWLRTRLQEKAARSYLHAAIYEDFARTNDLGLLRTMTSLDEDATWNSKKQIYDNLHYGRIGAGGLLTDACKTGNDEMALSAVSKRLKKASSAFKMAEVRSGRYASDVVKSIQSKIDSNELSLSNVIELLKRSRFNYYVQSSSDIFAANIYSSRFLTKEQRSKALSDRSHQQTYMSLQEQIHGSRLSYLAEREVELGSMEVGNYRANRTQIMKVLWGDIDSTRVWDAGRNADVEITRQGIFDAFGVQVTDANNITPGEYMELFHQCPSLITLHGPQFISPISDGSTSSVRTGTNGDLVQWLVHETKGGVIDKGNLSKQEHLMKAKIDLMQSPEIGSMVIATTPGIENMSMEETKRATSRALDKLAKQYLTALATKKGGEAMADLEARYASRRIAKLHKAAIAPQLMTSILEVQSDNAQERVVDELAKKVMKNSFENIAWASCRKVLREANSTSKSFVGPYAPGSENLFEGVLDAELKHFGSTVEDFISKNVDNYAGMLAASFRMVDIDSEAAILDKAGYGELSDPIRNEINKAIADLEEDIEIAREIDEDDAVRSLEAAKARLESILNNPYDISQYSSLILASEGLSGDLSIPVDTDLVDFLQGELLDLKTDFANNVRITNKEEYEAAKNAFLAKCLNLAKKYNSWEDLTPEGEFQDKARKFYVEAFGEWNDEAGRLKPVDSTEMKSKRMSVIRYFNGMMLRFFRNRSLQGFPANGYNEFSLGQELDLLDTWDRLIEDAREGDSQFISELSEEDKYVKDLGGSGITPDFNLSSKTVSFMATQVAGSAFAGGIESGIAADGATMKTLAGFAFLPHSYLQGMIPSQSVSAPKVNTFASMMGELSIYFQEPMHLKAKKTMVLGLKTLEEIKENEALKHSRTFSGDPDVIQGEMKAWLDEQRYEERTQTGTRLGVIARHFKESFKSAGDDLNWSDNHYKAFARVLTPFIEVTGKVRNGEGLIVDRTIKVNSIRVDNGHLFDGSETSKILEEMLANGSGLTVKAVPVSLQEASAKILRGLDDFLFEDGQFDEEKANKADVEKVALHSLQNWEMYNLEEGKLSIREVMTGIPARGIAIDSAVTADFNPTTVQKWYAGIGRTVMNGNLFGFDPDVEVKPLSRDEAKKLVSDISLDKSDYTGVITTVLMKENGSQSSTIMHKGSDWRMLTNFAKQVKPFDKAPNVIKYDDLSKDTAVLCVDDEMFSDSMRHAMNYGRDLIVPRESLSLLTSLGVEIRETDQARVMTLGGIDYFVVSNGVLTRAADNGITPEIFQYKIADPNSISIAIAMNDPLLPGDGGTIINPAMTQDIIVTDSSLMPMSSITTSDAAVMLVRDPSELKRIKLNGEDGNTDWSSYISRTERHLTTRSLRSYFEAAEAYLRDNENSASMLGPYLNNVSIGDCVGFIKIKEYGMEEYAPVFYEGSVARTATSLKLEYSDNGIRFRYQTHLDPTANYKLNYDGIEYKSFAGISPDGFAFGDINTSMLGSGLYRNMRQPRYIFDAGALSSRVFGKRFDTVIQNLFYGAMMSRGNLFCEMTTGGWKVRDDLSPQLKGETRTLVSLMNGEFTAWNNVANGSLSIFDASNSKENARLNDIISSLAKVILSFNGDPSLILSPTKITMDSEGEKLTAHGEQAILTNLGMVFGRFSTDLDSILLLYNKMNPQLCPKSTTEVDEGKTFLDAMGRVMYNGKRETAIIGRHYFTGETSELGDISRQATFGYQHLTKRLFDLGVGSATLAKVMGYLDTNAISGERGGSHDASEATIEDIFNNINFDEDKKDSFDLSQSSLKRQNAYLDNVKRFFDMPLYSSRANNHIRDCIELYQAQNKELVVKTDDRTKNYDEDIESKRKVEDHIEKLNRALGFDEKDRLSFAEISQLVRHFMGFYEIDGSSFNSITTRQFTSAIDTMMKNLDSDGVLIKGGRDMMAKSEVRVSIPLLPTYLSSHLFRSGKISSKWNSLDEFREAMVTELKENSLPQIQMIKSASKRNALYNLADAMAFANGLDQVSGSITGNMSIHEIITAAKQFGTNLEGYAGEITEKYDELCQLNEEKVAKLQELDNSRQLSIIPDATKSGGNTVIFDASDKQIGTWILRQLASTRVVMGLLHPMLTIGSIIERGVNQGMMSFSIQLGQAGIGQFAGKKLPWTKGFDIKAVCKEDDLVRLWSALRTAELNGYAEPLLNRMQTMGVKEAVDSLMKEQGFMEKFQNDLMNIASGKDVFITGQIKNFLDYIALHAQDEAPWLLMRENGMTILERQLRDNPARLVSDMLVGTSPGERASSLFARKALNWAKRGDMAQKNLVSAIYTELARRHATVNFGMVTLISPYFNYATNRLGRILQWVAPISSIHYVLTQSASEGALSKLHLPGLGKMPDGSKTTLGDLGLESAQVNMNLREAMAVDMMHLGPVLVAFLLVGTAGAVEPPDDEKKWCNFKEWTILGHRVDVAWWMEDILGLALPMACFMTSAANGRPCPEVLVNGMAYYLSNNPVIKVSDAVEVLFDPMASLYRDYDDDLESYAKAMGGAPSFDQMLQGKMTSFGLSYAAQFITPLALRDIYTSAQEYQVSHRKIYELNDAGKVSQEAIEEGRTQYTTYADAIIREQTKRNPVMGFLADLVLNGETGYMYHEMPRVVIYDPAQMESYQMFSIYADRATGELLPDDEKLTVAQAVITYLMSHDVEELQRIGFALDSPTRNYVGEVLWDMIADLNDKHYELEQSGALDPIVAGDGDWQAGKLLVDEYKKDHYDTIAQIKDLYYNKLWNEDITGLQKYWQKHTTYAQDSEGNWYATGQYPSWFTPITLAPGESPNEQWKETMGPEYDWSTQSKVTGGPTGIRALVPRPNDLGKTPSIDSYSSDGTDTGHSDSWNKRNGITPSGSSSSRYPYGSSSYGSGYPSGYRSRGSGGSGGGGGGGTPNIYANYRVPNSSYPRTMDRVNLKDAEYTYLRPNFETKGSREAYKRSDI